MDGLMQDWPLTLDKILAHAAACHGTTEIVSRDHEGLERRSSYAAAFSRAKRLSGALRAMGVTLGDRVATLGFNGLQHFESWYAIMGIGAVCHTLNPRMHPEQLRSILTLGGARILFVDPPLTGMILEALDELLAIERIVVMGANDFPPDVAGRQVVAYESLLDGAEATWGGFAETTAAGLCYTSGTTGQPKGVLYSHRSNFLHTLIASQSDAMGLSARDVVLPIVPMYHANAWGLTFSAAGVGAKLVLPGPRLDGPSVFTLLEAEQVTIAAAVPTVWQSLLHHLAETNQAPSSLKRVVIGGSACPPDMIRTFWDRYGIEVLHAWGMTETSPIATIGSPTRAIAALPMEDQLEMRRKQGRPPLMVEMRVVDETDAPLPHDGIHAGRILVRGPTIVDRYFGAPCESRPDGFFETGDIGTIDPYGFMHITDRAKDVIKSGGEWISSIELENIAVSHPAVRIAAIIAVPDPKWDERPLLVVALAPLAKASASELVAYYGDKVPRWWRPAQVAFVDQIPLGPTGKVDKAALRALHRDGRLDVHAACAGDPGQAA